MPVMKVTQKEGLWKLYFAPLMGLNYALCGDYGYRRLTKARDGDRSPLPFFENWKKVP